jgi:hypothetical protein
LEHGDHVYFFFREVSVEDARLGRVRRWALEVGNWRVLQEFLRSQFESGESSSP